jgi:hypothetical protein
VVENNQEESEEYSDEEVPRENFNMTKNKNASKMSNK